VKVARGVGKEDNAAEDGRAPKGLSRNDAVEKEPPIGN